MTSTLAELEAKMAKTGGSLDLSGTQITALPEDLSVGGSLDLSGTPIPVIFVDERDYELRAVAVGSSRWYVAGCRTFKSAEAALAHWGSDTYLNKTRGQAFCDAVRKDAENARL